MFIVRVVIVWALLSIIFLIIGRYFIIAFLPYLTFLLDIFAYNYTNALTITNDGFSSLIQTKITTTAIIYVNAIAVAPPGIELVASTNLVHSLVPVVILYTILLSWPNVAPKELVYLLIVSIPIMLLILGVSVASILTSHIQAAFFEEAMRISDRFIDPPFVVNWAIFLESGGRWLLPIIGAIICKSVTNRFH
ncbi:MAG: hypothetical protein AAGB35_03260 [Pseudomonadota bacterium]